MNYPNIHKHKLSHAIIAEAFKYKTIKSFRCSTAHRRIMQGIEALLTKIENDKLKNKDYGMD